MHITVSTTEPRFEDLPEQAQEDLIAWLNTSEPDDDDKDRLLKLVAEGRFRAWNCPGCTARVYDGEPRNWDYFQGARQVDYVSYPGRLELNEDANRLLCDTCRCHGTKFSQEILNAQAERDGWDAVRETLLTGMYDHY